MPQKPLFWSCMCNPIDTEVILNACVPGGSFLTTLENQVLIFKTVQIRLTFHISSYFKLLY